MFNQKCKTKINAYIRTLQPKSLLFPLFVFANRKIEGLKNNIKEEKRFFRKVNQQFK